MRKSGNLYNQLKEIRDRLTSSGDKVAEEAHLIDLQTEAIYKKQETLKAHSLS